MAARRTGTVAALIAETRHELHFANKIIVCGAAARRMRNRAERPEWHGATWNGQEPRAVARR